MTPPVAVEAEPALDALLGRLVAGSLVLTDGHGAISKWSDPADLLFGRAAEDVLGRAFFQTLIAAPLAPPGEGWRRYLEVGEAPAVRAKGGAPRAPRLGARLRHRARVHPGQVRRGLRLLALPRGPRLRAARGAEDRPAADPAPGGHAGAAGGALGGDPALGGLAHRGHPDRVPAPRPDAVGGGRAHRPGPGRRRGRGRCAGRAGARPRARRDRGDRRLRRREPDRRAPARCGSQARRPRGGHRRAPRRPAGRRAVQGAAGLRARGAPLPARVELRLRARAPRPARGGDPGARPGAPRGAGARTRRSRPPSPSRIPCTRCRPRPWSAPPVPPGASPSSGRS